MPVRGRSTCLRPGCAALGLKIAGPDLFGWGLIALLGVGAETGTFMLLWHWHR